jgi:hypothetical protein
VPNEIGPSVKGIDQIQVTAVDTIVGSGA